MPSLVPAICFEVRGEPLLAASPLAETAALPERLRLYRSTGTKPGSRLVVGYDEFEVPDGLLLGFFARIARVPIFAVPEVPLYCVADAVHLELAVGCGLGDLRVEWVEGCAPTAWTELEQIAKEMLATFETLSPIG
ncbi:MAG: hypothetical protein HOW73_22620 [Polyangiaceae bacterium]|nr:hypothetical protein [Polyangiaceae bacterium]